MAYSDDLTVEVDKFKAYHALMSDKILDYFKNGDIITGNSLFKIVEYFELYIWQLEYTLNWITGDVIDDDSPLTLSQIHDTIDKANEIITKIYSQPLILL